MYRNLRYGTVLVVVVVVGVVVVIVVVVIVVEQWWGRVATLWMPGQPLVFNTSMGLV